jgi:hypothetical protein
MAAFLANPAMHCCCPLEGAMTTAWRTSRSRFRNRMLLPLGGR